MQRISLEKYVFLCSGAGITVAIKTVIINTISQLRDYRVGD